MKPFPEVILPTAHPLYQQDASENFGYVMFSALFCRLQRPQLTYSKICISMLVGNAPFLQLFNAWTAARKSPS